MSSALHERLALVGTIDPDAHAASTYTTDAVDMSRFGRVLFTVLAGTLGGAVSFRIQESDDGTVWTDVVGKAIEPLASGTDDGTQAHVEVRSDELTEGDYLLRGYLFLEGTCDIGVTAFAGDPRYAPVTAEDLESVAQIVD